MLVYVPCFLSQNVIGGFRKGFATANIGLIYRIYNARVVSNNLEKDRCVAKRCILVCRILLLNVDVDETRQVCAFINELQLV